MAPDGSELSTESGFPFSFLFFVALSFRSFTGSHLIVPIVWGCDFTKEYKMELKNNNRSVTVDSFAISQGLMAINHLSDASSRC
jgi:hypothetical protein